MDFFTDFRTNTYIIIKSKWLRLPELGMLSIMAILCVWYLVFDLHFMRFESIRDHGAMRLRGPLADWDSECSYIKMNCPLVQSPDLEPCSTYNYAGNGSCVPKNSDLSPADAGETELRIAFSANSGNQDTLSQRKQVYDGVETWMLMLQHAFEAGDWYQTAEAVQGFLKMQNESEPRPMDQTRFPKVHMHDFWGARYSKACGTHNGNGSDTCMGTQAGDYVSVGLLLAAAGMKADDIREQGGSLTLNVDYTDGDLWDFWSLPFGPKPKYVLRPIQTRFSAHGTDIFYVHVEQGSPGEPDVTKPCLHIYKKVSGVHGEFSVITLLGKLTILSAAVAWAHLVVNRIVVKIYGWFDDLEHVTALHSMSVDRETVTDDDFFQMHHRLKNSIDQGSSRRPSTLIQVTSTRMPGDYLRDDNKPRCLTDQYQDA